MHACVVWSTPEVPVTRSTETSVGYSRGEILLVPANTKKKKRGTSRRNDLILVTANSNNVFSMPSTVLQTETDGPGAEE